MSAERQQAILQQQINEILFGIEQAKSQKAERYTIKQMERTVNLWRRSWRNSTTRAAKTMW